MNKLSDIAKLTKDREDIINILKFFDIEILKMESKNSEYIIHLGGINKAIFLKKRNEIESEFKNWKMLWR